MKKVLFSLFTVICITLCCFVACNNDLSKTSECTIAFAPSVTKALNQEGNESFISTSVDSYHWKYYCSTQEPGTNPTFTEFANNPSKGLGTIKGLQRGGKYYIGLQGYSDTELVWQGFHDGVVELKSKTQLVTVNVTNMGSGYLYFNISAPIVISDIITSGKPDRFLYQYTKLGESSTSSGILNGKLNSDSDAYYYIDSSNNPLKSLTTGTYLFTVWQQTWDGDNTTYTDVPSRKQVLVVDIQSGVDTVIAGSLDSTKGITYINYEANGYTNKNKQHILVSFTDSDPELVGEFVAKVYDSEETLQAAATTGNHDIEGQDGDVFKITWTTSSDYLKVYVNGAELLTSGSDFVTTGTDSFIARVDGEETILKSSAENEILAKVEKGRVYVVTIIHEEDGNRKSVSFTVKYTASPATMKSSKTFKIAAMNEASKTAKLWDGQIFYNNGNGWKEWNGEWISAGQSGDNYYLKLRGTGNTVLVGKDNYNCCWAYQGDAIDLSDLSMTALLDYTSESTEFTLGNNAFTYMFKNWPMTKAPALPFDKLSDGCYKYMFYNCNYLVSTPVLTATDMKNACYSYMFSNCKNLTSVSDLPATTLADSCYQSMFNACTSLVTPPALPATEMKQYCYAAMFSNCTALASCPALPAETLASNCYNAMFTNCTSLVSTPSLPATTAEEKCYYEMFAGCKALVNVSAISATTMATDCCWSMFKQCHSLVTPPSLPATNLAESCYREMFYNCDSLVSTPSLPATTAVTDCYRAMFKFCYALKNVSEISATKMGVRSCQQMFQYCTSLVTAPSLPATTLAESCYAFMFADCRKLSNPPQTLPATTMVRMCYRAMFVNCVELVNLPDNYLHSTKLAPCCYSSMFTHTGLVKAPALPATEPAIECYAYMFAWCTSLTDLTLTNDVYLQFTSFSSNWELHKHEYIAMFAKCTSLVVSANDQGDDTHQGTAKKIFDNLPTETVFTGEYFERGYHGYHMFGWSTANLTEYDVTLSDEQAYPILINGAEVTPAGGSTYYVIVPN